jgi:hypothetical protein
MIYRVIDAHNDRIIKECEDLETARQIMRVNAGDQKGWYILPITNLNEDQGTFPTFLVD